MMILKKTINIVVVLLMSGLAILSVKSYLDIQPLKLTRPCFFQTLTILAIVILSVPVYILNCLRNTDLKNKLIDLNFAVLMILTIVSLMFEMQVKYFYFMFRPDSYIWAYILQAALYISLFLRYRGVINKFIPIIISVLYIAFNAYYYLSNEFTIITYEIVNMFTSLLLGILFLNTTTPESKIVVNYNEEVFGSE